MSWSLSSCTSAAANDGVWHIAAARGIRFARNPEVGLDPRLVVVRAHVLLDLQLDAVSTRPPPPGGVRSPLPRGPPPPRRPPCFSCFFGVSAAEGPGPPPQTKKKKQ